MGIKVFLQNSATASLKIGFNYRLKADLRVSHLRLISNDDIILHRHRNVIDKKFQGRALKDPHKSSSCPCDWASGDRLTNNDNSVLTAEEFINSISDHKKTLCDSAMLSSVFQWI